MYFSVLIFRMNITELWFVKGFGWLLIGFVGAGRRSERWRESHLPVKVLLLIMPWRLLLHGSDIISTWSNSYVLFRTKESLSFCVTQKTSCYFKHSFVGVQGTAYTILMSPNSSWTPFQQLPCLQPSFYQNFASYSNTEVQRSTFRTHLSAGFWLSFENSLETYVVGQDF